MPTDPTTRAAQRIADIIAEETTEHGHVEPNTMERWREIIAEERDDEMKDMKRLVRALRGVLAWYKVRGSRPPIRHLDTLSKLQERRGPEWVHGEDDG